MILPCFDIAMKSFIFTYRGNAGRYDHESTRRIARKKFLRNTSRGNSLALINATIPTRPARRVRRADGGKS